MYDRLISQCLVGGLPMFPLLINPSLRFDGPRGESPATNPAGSSAGNARLRWASGPSLGSFVPRLGLGDGSGMRGACHGQNRFNLQLCRLSGHFDRSVIQGRIIHWKSCPRFLVPADAPKLAILMRMFTYDHVTVAKSSNWILGVPYFCTTKRDGAK